MTAQNHPTQSFSTQRPDGDLMSNPQIPATPTPPTQSAQHPERKLRLVHPLPEAADERRSSPSPASGPPQQNLVPAPPLLATPVQQSGPHRSPLEGVEPVPERSPVQSSQRPDRELRLVPPVPEAGDDRSTLPRPTAPVPSPVPPLRVTTAPASASGPHRSQREGADSIRPDRELRLVPPAPEPPDDRRPSPIPTAPVPGPHLVSTIPTAPAPSPDLHRPERESIPKVTSPTGSAEHGENPRTSPRATTPGLHPKRPNPVSITNEPPTEPTPPATPGQLALPLPIVASGKGPTPRQARDKRSAA